MTVVPLDRAVHALILREMAIAKAKYGEDNFELLCIKGSFENGILDDHVTLMHLRRLNRTGSLYIQQVD